MEDGRRLALVTGASTGIGAALVDTLLAGGWEVVGLARRGVAVAHARLHPVAVDLGDADALERVIAHELAPRLAAGPWARVALVNNAARLGDLARVTDFTAAGLHGILAVNAAAP